MIVTPYFAAVIDGATAKSTFTYDGKKTGRLAMELALEAIRDFPKDIDAAGAISRITEKIHDFYVEHNLLDELKAEPGKRFTANGVIYSYARNEVWRWGIVSVSLVICIRLMRKRLMLSWRMHVRWSMKLLCWVGLR